MHENRQALPTKTSEDVKTMLWWFYCQPQTRSTHGSSAPLFHSKQKNAGNIDIVEETTAFREGRGYSFLISSSSRQDI